MNITYTGRHGELPPDQQKKLDARLAKLSKLVERKGGEKGAHAAITVQRHLTKAEVTLNYYDHPLAGQGSGADFFTAMYGALDTLEKQVLKVQAKRRAGVRGLQDKSNAAADLAPVSTEQEAGPRIHHVNHHEKRKPMTLEEAMIAIDKHNYLVYRDADKDRISVLIRRADGNFDLVES